MKEAALELFRRHNRYSGMALENHCIRLAKFTLALGERWDVEMDPELVWAACYVHDIGLLVEEPGNLSYMSRGWRFVKPHVEEWGVEGAAKRVFRDIMLYNHGLLPLRGVSWVGEMCRRAVQVEHSKGLVHHGLSRDVVRSIFAETPRLGLTRVLLDFARITVLEDGPLQLAKILVPRITGSD